MNPARAGRGHGDVTQRAAHIWKKLLRTATGAESKQVQDVTARMSAARSGSRNHRSGEGGMRMEQPRGSGNAPNALQSKCAALFLGCWKGTRVPVTFWVECAGRVRAGWILGVVTIPMSLGWAPPGASPAEGQSLSWCWRCGTTVGLCMGPPQIPWSCSSFAPSVPRMRILGYPAPG